MKLQTQSALALMVDTVMPGRVGRFCTEPYIRLICGTYSGASIAGDKICHLTTSPYVIPQHNAYQAPDTAVNM